MEVNKKSDILKKWTILGDLKVFNLTLERLVEDADGLTLFMNAENEFEDVLNIKLNFENYLAYRNTAERYMWKIWSENPREILGYHFYITDNSSYVKYIKEMSLSAYDDEDISHYCIYALFDCVDILTPPMPNISFSVINKNDDISGRSVNL